MAGGPSLPEAFALGKGSGAPGPPRMSRSPPERRARTVSARGPRASRERQRQRLIDACISALHVYGPSNTTVEKVVAIARMSPGIVRFYFDSKAAMLVASLEYLAAEFEEKLLVPVGALKAQPVEALERLVEIYLGPEIASARKVSVWYSFWGEASSRQEYFDICGTRDERFEALLRELIGRLIADTDSRHLDTDAIALGLYGVLDMLWQSYAFQTESTIDRAQARRRCMAYLRSVFPTLFPRRPAAPASPELPAGAYANAGLFEAERTGLFNGSWQFIGLERELESPGSFLTLEVPGLRALLVRQPDGALRAFHNACRQRPHALAEARRGEFARRIECPVHGLSYELSGEPLGRTPGGALAGLEIATSGDLVFVRAPLERGTAPAAPAPRAAVLDRGLELVGDPEEIDVAADWKLLVEHWLESPGLTLTGTSPADGVEFSGDIAADAGWAGQRYRALLPAGSSRWQRSYVAPNQLIDRRPGRVEVTQLLPLAAGRCRLRLYACGTLAADARERALAYLAARLARARLADDLALASSVQKGLDASVEGHAPLGETPLALAEFRHRIARLLPAALRHPGDPT